MFMLPLFKSNFSIGKSILRLDEKSFEEDSPSSIFKILKDNDIQNLVLVEDTMIGFLESYHNCRNFGVNLIFGLNLFYKSSTDQESKDKITIFSKNEKGCKSLNKIYSFAQTEGDGSIDFLNLKKIWTDDLLMYIPFYDSFLYNNFMYFSESYCDLSFFNPCFFIQNNNLPFDGLLKERVIKFCKKNKFKTMLSKSIYYNKKSDLSAYQVYKCLCSRSFSNKASLEKPNLDHCSSADFSFESFLEHESS